MSRTIMRYSEAFKLQIVNELESGKLSCIHEAREYYGIVGSDTIQYWLRKHGINIILILLFLKRLILSIIIV